MSTVAAHRQAFLAADIAALEKLEQLRVARDAYQVHQASRDEWMGKLRQAHAGSLVIDESEAWAAVSAAEAAMSSQEAAIRSLRLEVTSSMNARKQAQQALRTAEGMSAPMTEDAPAASIDSMILQRSLDVKDVMTANKEGVLLSVPLTLGAGFSGGALEADSLVIEDVMTADQEGVTLSVPLTLNAGLSGGVLEVDSLVAQDVNAETLAVTGNASIVGQLTLRGGLVLL